eukprot:symbB.v1.2.010998.t1/scaffold687.1/size172701/4
MAPEAHQITRQSGEQLVAETIGGEAPQVGGKRKRGRPSAAEKKMLEEVEAPKTAIVDLLKLEEDPSLQAEGAVVDDNGALVNSYYKRFIQAFKDAEKARADVAAPTGLKRPGVRPGEEIPDLVRFWDDSLGRRKVVAMTGWFGALFGFGAAQAVVLGTGILEASKFYGLSARDSAGGVFSFESLKGASAVLITNVASE